MNIMKTMHINNKISVGVFLFFLLSAPSCGDLLQEDVISAIGNDYLNTPAGVNDGVNAAYSSIRAWYGTERGNNFTIFGTDTHTNGADGSWKFMNTYDSQFDSRNGHVQDIWNELYRGINTCYFILTQLFGGVDLRLKETVAPTKEVTRSTVQAQYAAIIKDLTEAIPDLEAKAKATLYGKATRPAAEHLLGKVYLTKSTSEAKANDDLAKAIPLFQNVINNYGIKLLPDFGLVHREGNEINDEVIWSVQYTRDPLTNGGGNNAHVFFLMEYDIQPGMQRDVANGRPFKRYMPTKYTIDVVFKDKENDSRYKKTFKDVYFSNRPGTYNTSFDNSKAKVTFAAGDTCIFLPGYEMPMAERAAKKYQVLVPSRYDERIYPSVSKHIDGGRIDRTQFEGGRDYIAFRLADTYLMLAEAQLLTGNKDGAVATINAVRRRAAFPGKQAAMEITADQMNLELIIEERERELIGEQMRWFDLKRWGILVERVQKYNPQGAPNIKPFHALRPIPQVQIDRVTGNASAFAQNPGY